MFGIEIELSKLDSIINDFRSAIFEIKKQSSYSEINAAVPKYFQKILQGEFQRRYYVNIKAEELEMKRFYDAKIVDGYEDAIVIFDTNIPYPNKENIKRIELNLIKN